MNLTSRFMRLVGTAIAAASLLASSLAIVAPTLVSAAGGTACPNTTVEAGSTTVYPALLQAQSGFQSTFGCSLTLGQQGSGAGISSLNSGTSVDIAASSRPLSSSEKTLDYYWQVGGDAMVIAVKAGFCASSITSAQVAAIYSGTLTDWHDVSGSCAAGTTIVPRSRTTVSGSYSDLLRIFGISAGAEATTITNTGLARLQTSQDEADAACSNSGQVVYTSLANLLTFGPAGSNCLKALTLDGVAPSVTTVQNGTYTAPRQLFLVMRRSEFSGNASDSGVTHAMDLVNYMLSSTGQAAVGFVGFVQQAVPSSKPVTEYDVNSDGAIGLGDIGQITGKWSQTSSCIGWIRADINNDGAIGLGDIGQVTGHWGQVLGNWPPQP
jgi:phosphate transport system substrate-binding protein